ncbi:putative transporter or flippase [Scheffersomyces stipitis CBS 6054]|uniref:Sphingoid long-chain base transporter RSB1 n=1 Tax=Scheffersomyces stipitis (strain ATCC 58785 / CBS 6054 / NBRC 10063 / NRRL Y-11545) TaxID=322104 RepID=A3LW05_PICST|nr:putative transporter or flippase [Scheffersomyces stipitis CBS 6054]ABN66877.2 putative transporter or flippase [Scheffersomyces stipitis CBS 6054]KAG2734422.1 hypothetical protein G9P44_002428 [Scheffersomyces stipitis]
MSQFFPDGLLTSLPTKTTLLSVNPTKSAALLSKLTSATAAIATKHGKGGVQATRALIGAQASLAIISAEGVIATATDSSVLAEATDAIFRATVNLQELAWDMNVYDIRRLDRGGNIFYLVIFALTAFFTCFMCIKSRYHWYNVAFSGGLLLEFIGFLGRVLSFTDMTDSNFFIMQLVCLTIAPAFLMGGIYFLFAQLVAIHGRKFSLLKPMWYSYLFIGCDILSLVIQSAGGAQASYASNNGTDATPGTRVMIAGIGFQVAAMSVFMVFWGFFLVRLYFKRDHRHNDVEEVDEKTAEVEPVLHKKSFKNFLILHLNGKKAQQFKSSYLEQFYNPRYAEIRQRKLYNWFPLVISASVIVIYIRCVYRVVELAQGFSGYLITHEVYLFVLDAMMISIVALLFMVFHPYFVLGPEVTVTVKSIKNNEDEEPHQDSSEVEEEGVGVGEGEGEVTEPKIQDQEGTVTVTVSNEALNDKQGTREETATREDTQEGSYSEQSLENPFQKPTENW